MIRVRISIDGWRVWSPAGRVATIRQGGGVFTLHQFPSDRPIAYSRHWARVATFARDRYSSGGH